MGKTASNQAVQNFEPKYGQILIDLIPPHSHLLVFFSSIVFSISRDSICSLVLSGRSSLMFNYEPQF